MKIEDVISIGYVSIENRVLEFQPLMHTIYFKFKDGYYCFHANESTLKLELEVVEKIDYSYEICEEIMYSCASIVHIVLPTTGDFDTSISKIQFYNMEKSEDKISSDACEITLAKGGTIFLDPAWLCGINIGGEEVKRLFMDNFEGEFEISELEA